MVLSFFYDMVKKRTEKQYWLMKSEPDAYSIDDLEKDGKECWDGIRNYQARNFMMKDMQIGDEVLFYHSNAKPPGVAGLARVCSEAYPDHTAWDPESKYFDSRSTPEKPLWFMVDLAFVKKFPRIISLSELKENPALAGMMVIKKGMRLSIQPVSEEHFTIICMMGENG